MSYATFHDLLDDFDAERPDRPTRQARAREADKAASNERPQPGNTANKAA